MVGGPRAPFDRWPIQHFDRLYGYAWYLGRGVIVSHITVKHGTAASAHAYHDYETDILSRHAPEITKVGGIFVIHDWRAMTTYDGEARRVWQDRMQDHEKGYLRGSVVCLVRASALLKMAVQAANLFASIHHGAKVELTTDIDAALTAHGVHP